MVILILTFRSDDDGGNKEFLETVSQKKLSVTKSPRNRFYESRFSRKQLLITSSIPSTTSKSQLLYHSEGR